MIATICVSHFAGFTKFIINKLHNFRLVDQMGMEVWAKLFTCSGAVTRLLQMPATPQGYPGQTIPR